MPLTTIRSGTQADIAVLQEIESDSAALYLSLSEYRFCTELPVRSQDEHTTVLTNGAAFVVERENVAIGFVLALPMDRRAHILELSVRRSHQKRGVGRMLMNTTETWARVQGNCEITLTTFRDVPWNAPAYLRQGYDVFTPQADGVQFNALQAKERTVGFYQKPRVAMLKKIDRSQAFASTV